MTVRSRPGISTMRHNRPSTKSIVFYATTALKNRMNSVRRVPGGGHRNLRQGHTCIYSKPGQTLSVDELTVVVEMKLWAYAKRSRLIEAAKDALAAMDRNGGKAGL